MSNEIREKGPRVGKGVPLEFRQAAGLARKVVGKRQTGSAYGDELLTDKEAAYLLKVEPENLCRTTATTAFYLTHK